MIETIPSTFTVNNWGQVEEVESHEVDTESKEYIEANELLS